ncbi:hypothetical protein NLI96_g3115 [Meripilus lineatus]|uniref:Uncharacterized protein n=1 Tax=Meripilus lineatus TaxID=2056292 RepID=A0AAD5V7B4_9APHY|nr:hypothetical protein NLI96_g3115 [Physisporinus lineatus]
MILSENAISCRLPPSSPSESPLVFLLSLRIPDRLRAVTDSIPERYDRPCTCVLTRMTGLPNNSTEPSEISLGQQALRIKRTLSRFQAYYLMDGGRCFVEPIGQ